MTPKQKSDRFHSSHSRERNVTITRGDQYDPIWMCLAVSAFVWWIGVPAAFCFSMLYPYPLPLFCFFPALPWLSFWSQRHLTLVVMFLRLPAQEHLLREVYFHYFAHLKQQLGTDELLPGQVCEENWFRLVLEKGAVCEWTQMHGGLRMINPRLHPSGSMVFGTRQRGDRSWGDTAVLESVFQVTVLSGQQKSHNVNGAKADLVVVNEYLSSVFFIINFILHSDRVVITHYLFWRPTRKKTQMCFVL